MITCRACGNGFLPRVASQVEHHVCHNCHEFFKDMRCTTDHKGNWVFLPVCQLSYEEEEDLNEIKKRIPDYFDSRLNLPPMLFHDLGFLIGLLDKVTKKMG